MGNCQSTVAANEYGQYIDHKFQKRWDLCNKVLGKGFGEVHLVKHKKTKTLAAAKVLNKSNMTQDDIDAVKQEVMIIEKTAAPMSRAVHRFLRRKDEDDRRDGVLGGGALFDRIVTRKHYNELIARDLIYVFLVGLKQCHDQNIIHRDLKPENLILAGTANDSEVKIADFGLSVLETENTVKDRSIACGTPAYLAPEMILAAMGQLEGKAYGKVDLWAVGCLAYVLLAGRPPSFQAPTIHKTRECTALY